MPLASKTPDQQQTTVVNIRHKPNAFDVYVGRTGLGLTSEFGNPFKIYKDGTRDEIIEKFKKYFYNRLEKDKEFKKHVLELKGLRLGCFCAPRRCHSDVIAAYLNSLP